MKNAGFYSIVQFCPDAERRETVNVGVVVGAPALGLRVRMAERNEHVKNVFGGTSYDETRLSLAKTGLARRLAAVDATREALTAFTSKEAGKLVLSSPQPMVVSNLVDDCLALFLRLVSDPELKHREGRTPKPQLRDTYRKLKRKNVPLEWKPTITVPIIEEPLKADIAFQNGTRNFVKAIGLSPYEDSALDEIAHQASRGLLLATHTGGKLIIVAELDKSLRDRARSLLYDHQSRLVDLDDLASFEQEIERDAH
ncbi:MAG TPA: DUF3037 domain-containing protein [Kofleriaceae bacterium]|jgi:hypothetical protein